MMKRKLLLTFVSVAMVSFAAYSSLQSNEDASLTDMAMENAEALASDEHPCPWGCLAKYGFCVSTEIIRLKKLNQKSILQLPLSSL